MSTDGWQVADLDLEGYLERIGVPARAPGRAALAELHEAHVRAFTFDNVDVLLRRHPGVSLAAVQDKFVGRGRGGYCFEHTTIVAAALERLGYDVRRHLGRVGDPATGAQQARTHMTVEVVLDGERLLCDPGFGMSLLRPIAMVDGAEDDYLRGWRHRLRRTADGAWALHRLRESGWEVAHTVDELPVTPLDVVMGHHFTSTFPDSHFTHGLMVARHLPGRHVTVTHDTLTVRTPGGPTEHRPLRDGELAWWLSTLDARLSEEELAALVEWDQARRRSTGAGAYGRPMPADETQDDSTIDEIVAEAALQLWSAAQTDFDPFELPSEEWPDNPVPVRDADLAVDTRLEVEDVRAALDRLDGLKVVVGNDGGTRSVLRVIPADAPL